MGDLEILWKKNNTNHTLTCYYNYKVLFNKSIFKQIIQ